MSTGPNSCAARVVLIGDTKVGKTTLIHRYLHGQAGCQSPTVGAVFHTHRTVYQGVEITLQIWDTAGQERYRALGPIYYRKSIAAVAVFDLTAPDTMESLDNWIAAFREHAESQFVVIVGNKSDLSTELTPEVTETFAAQFDATCIWASAMNGDHVNDVFEAVCKFVAENGFRANLSPRTSVVEGKDDTEGACAGC
jgi:small GTP-binding protein